MEKKILIAVEINFETSSILTQTVSFFRESLSKFYILHVISAPPFSSINKKNSLHVEMEASYKNVEDELTKSGLRYLNYEIFISHGFPTVEILNFSIKNDINMIAVGTHQKTGFKEFVSGSISSSVAKNSICPVLLIPLKNLAKLSEEEESAEESAVSLLKI